MSQNQQLSVLGQFVTANATTNTATFSNAVVAVTGSFTNHTYANGEGVGTTYLIDDFSHQFNGFSNTFALTVNSVSITPSNPSMINIVIGGIPVTPASYIRDFQNLPELYTFKSGFVVSGSNVSFSTAPMPGMSFYGTYRTSQDAAPSFSYKQTPFSAINIMFGA